MMRIIAKRSALMLLSAAAIAAFLTSGGLTLAFEGQGVAVTLPQDIQFKSPLAGGRYALRRPDKGRDVRATG